MTESALLTRVSLLSALFFLTHVVSDLVLGLDRVGTQNLGLCVILLVWVYATLMLGDRKLGQAILLLGSILAAGVTFLHRGSLTSEFVERDGATLFLWVLFAMGTSGLFGGILAVRALMRRKA